MCQSTMNSKEKSFKKQSKAFCYFVLSSSADCPTHFPGANKEEMDRLMWLLLNHLLCEQRTCFSQLYKSQLFFSPWAVVWALSKGRFGPLLELQEADSDLCRHNCFPLLSLMAFWIIQVIFSAQSWGYIHWDWLCTKTLNARHSPENSVSPPLLMESRSDMRLSWRLTLHADFGLKSLSRAKDRRNTVS